MTQQIKQTMGGLGGMLLVIACTAGALQVPEPEPTPVAIKAEQVSKLELAQYRVQQAQQTVAVAQAQLKAVQAEFDTAVRDVALELGLNLKTHDLRIEMVEGKAVFTVRKKQ